MEKELIKSAVALLYSNDNTLPCESSSALKNQVNVIALALGFIPNARAVFIRPQILALYLKAIGKKEFAKMAQGELPKELENLGARYSSLPGSKKENAINDVISKFEVENKREIFDILRDRILTEKIARHA